MVRHLFWAVLAGLAAFSPASAVTAGGILDRLFATDLRVATSGFRLVTAASPRCARQMPGTGLLLHSLSQYSAGTRAEVEALRAFPTAVAVADVVPGSPAARADLRAGDGIAAINGEPLPASAPPGSGSTALRDAAEDRLLALPPSAPIRLRIRRGEAWLETVLVPVPACATRIEVVAGSALKARSDGRIIQIGQAFAESLDDEGLAAALAHELAHTVLDHRRQLAPLEQAAPGPALRRQRTALARQFEDEADLTSLDLLRLACWDPAIAPKFLRRTGVRFDPFLGGSGTHRSARERAARMDRAIPALPPLPDSCRVKPV